MSSVSDRSLNTEGRSQPAIWRTNLPNQGDTGVPKLSANAITAHLAATVAGLPVYVHTIEHADGVVLVDTGMLDSTPELDEEGAPVPMPENIPRDVVCVINTHLHFDHCGGNRLFPGVPIHVQARELADARSLDDYT